MRGAVGYIGYDVIRQYENIGADLHDPLNIPEVHLLLYREFIVYDHLRQKLSFVCMYAGKMIQQIMKKYTKGCKYTRGSATGRRSGSS
ncbi:hypothetical protein ACT7DP_20680 [Bacillus paranthracis]